MAEIELFQFRGSHFNEKARWALDWKGVRHERISLLPGPHAITTQRLSGQTQTPVLRDRGEVIAGSARILAHLERRFPEPALVPEDPASRRRALEIQAEFDCEVGPAIRCAKFFDVMEADYATAAFCDDRGAAARALYRACFPLVQGVMRRSMGIDARSAARGRERTARAFEFVAKQAGPSGYLVGDRFSVADLVCAALLMPGVAVAEWGGPRDPETDEVRFFRARWADLPGAAWVREMYRRHRRPRSA